MRALILAASMLAIIVGAAALSGCLSGQGQQSLIGASMDWRRANSVPAGMVGNILNGKRK
jgi:hypothetical protein